MADICPVCGEPHGKGVPNSKFNPGVAAEAPQEVTTTSVVEHPTLAEDIEEVIKELDDMGIVPDDVPGELVEESTHEADESEDPPDREHLMFRDLRAEAAERNITVPFGATKAILIGLLAEDDTP